MSFRMKLSCLLLVSLCCVTILAAPSTDQESEGSSDDKKLEVRQLHIESNINYRYAETVISSLVVNPSSSAKEYVFHVVLPEEAFITGFVMTINEKDYWASVKEKEEAKREYLEAVEQDMAAAHVSYNARDSNDFKVDLNIEPLAKVRFNLTYEAFLPRTLGHYDHKINVNPGQIVEDLMIMVNIKENLPITKLKVPELKMSNEISAEEEEINALAKIDKKNDKEISITWAPTVEEQRELKNEGVSGQFIVKYDVDRAEHSQQILVNNGHFVHYFADDSIPPLDKHVVFILDVSGSMAGRKIEQLKTAMNRILSELKETDYFSIVLFSNVASAWELNGPVPRLYWSRNEEKSELTANHIIKSSKENIDSARKFIDQLDDMGGTNIIAGLRNGLQLVDLSPQVLHKPEPEVIPKPIVVFLTDGEPNIEESNPSRITEITTNLNNGRSPIYSLGFGTGADMNFLKNLSLANNGFARHIYEASDADLQLQNFFKMISSPLLSGIKFVYVPTSVEEVTKSNFFAMYSGEELVVAGKLPEGKNELSGKIVVQGRSGDQEFSLPEAILIDRIPIPPTAEVRNRTFGPLEKLWAYKRIKQLLDNHTLTSDESVKKEALELALQYSFVTPLTSLIVVKPNETKAVNAEKLTEDSGYPQARSSPWMARKGVYGAYGASFPSAGYVTGMGGYHMSAFPAAPAVFPSMALPMTPPPRLGLGVNRFNLAMDKMTTVNQNSMQLPDMVDFSMPPDTRVNISEIMWLDQSSAKEINGSSYLTFPSGQSPENLVSLNATDIAYEPCQANQKNGHCRHLIHCSMESFKTDVSLYLDRYYCPIKTPDDVIFSGVCCPDSFR